MRLIISVMKVTRSYAVMLPRGSLSHSAEENDRRSTSARRHLTVAENAILCFTVACMTKTRLVLVCARLTNVCVAVLTTNLTKSFLIKSKSKRAY